MEVWAATKHRVYTHKHEGPVEPSAEKRSDRA